MLKVGRKRNRKERTKDKKHTNSIAARIRARASRPVVNFACLKPRSQENKIQDTLIRSLNIMSGTITRPTV